jgi:hypothetical protein
MIRDNDTVDFDGHSFLGVLCSLNAICHNQSNMNVP